MLEIILIRHGRTDWNDTRRVMGRQPIPLNELGRAQARAAGEYLRAVPLASVITSPVLRAVETARIIASFHEGLSVEEDERISEIDYGEWVNMTFDELTEKRGEELRRYIEDPNDLVLPGGESMRDVAARVGSLLGEVRSRFADGRVVLVSHADVIKIALLDLLGLDVKNIMRFSIDNCAVVLVRIHPDIGPRLVLYNHLGKLGSDARFFTAREAEGSA